MTNFELFAYFGAPALMLGTALVLAWYAKHHA